MYKPVRSRVVLDDNRISIASRKFWFFLIFWGIWLVIWIVGGVAALVALLHDKSQPRLAVLVAAFIAWAVAGLCVALFWLWFACGREVINVAEGKLILRNEILGRGRSEVFPLAQVSNLRACGLFGSFYTWSAMLQVYGLSGGMIAFECGGRTHRFGKLLEEGEASEIVKELRSRIDSAAQQR